MVIRIPKLDMLTSIIPNTLALSFEFANKNTKTRFNNNLAACLIERLKIKIGSVLVYDNNRQNTLDLFKDKWWSSGYLSSSKMLNNLVKNTRSMTLETKEEMEAMNFLIAGRTISGKTRLLLKILEDELMDQYDDIFLVCPTYKTNFAYQNWEFKDLENWHPICCSLDDVNYVLRMIQKNVKGKTLVILDDCASSKDVSKQKNSTDSSRPRRKT